MKKLIILFVVFFSCIYNNVLHAQTHDGMYFQGAARNANGNVLINTPINLRYSIHDSLANGVVIYQETFSTTTTAQGMFTVTIGKGTPVIGNYNTINWGKNDKFVQTEIATNGNNFVDMGTTQMMSVPYALYAKRADSANNGLPLGNTGDILFFNGNGWQKLNAGNEGQVLTMNSGIPTWKMPTISVGSFYGGGIVAYLLKPGDVGYDPNIQHGLIASPTNIGQAQWGCYGNFLGDTSTVFGSGQSNTNNILSGCSQSNIAARLCDNLILNGFSDWYLPSSEEMIKLLFVRNIIGGFSPNQDYWTSTESGQYSAISVYVNISYTTINNESFTQTSKNKNIVGLVRAIRSF